MLVHYLAWNDIFWCFSLINRFSFLYQKEKKSIYQKRLTVLGHFSLASFVLRLIYSYMLQFNSLIYNISLLLDLLLHNAVSIVILQHLLHLLIMKKAST